MRLFWPADFCYLLLYYCTNTVITAQYPASDLVDCGRGV